MASLLQAEYTRLFKEWVEAGGIAAYRMLKQIKKYFSRSIHVIYEYATDATTRRDTYLSLWRLTGYKRGVNSKADGTLYIDLTDENPGAGSALVEVYDYSGGTLVASGSSTNNSTVTLAEQNNSGLSGTVYLGAPAANADFDLVVESSYADRANDVDSDLSDRDESKMLSDIKGYALSAADETADAFDEELARWKSNMDNYILKVIADKIESGSNYVISNMHTRNSDRSVTVTANGVLEDLRLQMARAAADIQYFANNTVTVPTLAQGDATQQGDATLGSTVIREYIRPAQITFRCIKTLTGTPEEFRVEQAAFDGNGKITAYLNAFMGALWQDTQIGLTGQLTRVITDDHGGGDLSAWSITGETSSNTDVANNKLYGSIATVGATSTLIIYSDAAHANEVARGTGTTGGGAFTITFSSTGGSGLSGSVTSADPPADDLDFDITLNIFEVNDTMTTTPTNDDASIWMNFIGLVYGVALGSNAAETITDTLIQDSFDLTDESYDRVVG